MAIGGLQIDGALVRAGERVCVAVSGGADSTALLLALVEANAAGAEGVAVKSKGRQPLGIVLRAAHVHHGLRGAEADADEAFVRGLCGRLGVPLTVFRVDTVARQAETGEGVEEAARELRYAALRGLMAEGQVDVVATAHTLDDQAETVMMKLLRGAWTEGLGGISPEVQGPGSRAQGPESGERGAAAIGEKQVLPLRQAQGQDDNSVARGRSSEAMGRVVRPMLGVRRAEVEAFLKSRGQGWREDRSNRDVSLTRNRVRWELMPLLRGFNPGIDELLANVATIARDEEAHWEAELRGILPQLVLPGKPVRGGGRAVSTAVGESECALEIERLKAMDAATRRRVVRSAARSVGARLSFEETAKVLALAGLGGHAGVSGRAGSRLELRGGLRVERSARELRLSRRGAGVGL